MKKSTIFGLALGMMAIGTMGAGAAVNYTLEPAPGSSLQEMGDFTITFTGDPVYFHSNGSTPVLEVVNIYLPKEKNWKCYSPKVVEDGRVYRFQDFVSDWPYYTTESSIYNVTISGMYQVVNGEEVAVEDITASYTIEYPYSVVLNPTDEDATNLQGLSVTFSGLDADYPSGNEWYAVLNGPRRNYESKTFTRTYDAATGSTFTFNFSIIGDVDDTDPTVISDPGTYYLTVVGPAVGMVDGLLDDNSEVLPTYYAIYTIKAGSDVPETFYMEEGTMIEPEGNYVSSVGFITISYGGSKLQLVSPSDKENEDGVFVSKKPIELLVAGESYPTSLYPYVFTIPAGGNDPGVAWKLSDDAEDDMEAEDFLQVSLGELLESYLWILPTGKYTVTVPEGIVKNDAGAINPEQSFSFYLMRSTDAGEVTPPEMDEDWNMIEYAAAELEAVAVNWGASIEKIEGSLDVTLAKNEFMTSSPATPLLYGQEVKINGENLMINLSQVAPGSWSVNIPEGYVIVGGEKINTDQAISYTIVDKKTNSVIALDANADGLYKVYDLNGVNVLNTEDAGAIRGLDAGIYVINGKKVLVRE